MSKFINFIVLLLWLGSAIPIIAKPSNVITATTELNNQASIKCPPSKLKATIFPFQIRHDIELHYNSTNDGPFDLPTLKVLVRHGTLVPTNPFPGLYVNNNKNEKVIKATGPIEDLQRWIESDGRSILDDNTTTSATMYHDQIFPGGGIKYMPPYYDWIGIDEIQLELIRPKTRTAKALVLATAKVELDIEPYLEMKLQIVLPPPNDANVTAATTTTTSDTIQMNEDETCRTFQKDSSDFGKGVAVSIEGVARTKDISCSFMATSGKFKPKRFHGTIGQINDMMAKVVYTPKDNYNGKVHVTLSCYNDYDDQYDEGEFVINVKAVNDRPEIMIRPDRVFETKEDQRLNLGATANLFVVDLDAHESKKSRIAIDLNVTKGDIFLHLPPPEYLGGIFVSSDSMSNILLFGYIDDINIALQYATISFGADWYGIGSINIKCTDVFEFGSKPMEVFYFDWINDHIDYVVESVNDAPTVSIHKTNVEVWEGDKIASFHQLISINDVDSHSSEQLNVTIEMSEVNGLMPGYILSQNISIPVHGERSKGKLSTVFMQTNLIELPFHLKSIRPVFWEDWYGFCYECISVHVIDVHGDEVTGKLSIKVIPINDAPIFTMSRNTISTNEEEKVSLSSVIELAVHDADELYATKPILYSFKIKALNGGLLGFDNYIAGCHIIEGDPYVELKPILTLQGSTAIINEALKTLYYKPPLNFDNAETMIFEVTDEKGLKHNDTLEIQVAGMNDPPKVEFHSVEKKQDLAGNPFFKTGLDISDPDSNEFVTLTIKLQPPSQGSIHCPYLDKVGVSIETNSPDKVVLSGDIESIRMVTTEITISLIEVETDEVFILTAIVIDEGGQSQQVMKEIQREVNVTLPTLTRANDTISMFEDETLRLVHFIHFGNEGHFKESLIFEMKFTCPTDKIYRDRGVAFAAPYFQFIDLSLPGIHILRYDVDRGSMGTISFRGNAIALKNALQKLQFLPPLNFSGKLTIVYGVRSIKNYEISDIFTTEEIELEIFPVDDSPVILWDQAPFLDNDPVVDLDEDTLEKFGGMVSVEDDDIYDDHISFDIKTSYGTLCSSWIANDLFGSHDFIIFFNDNENEEYLCLGQNITFKSTIDYFNRMMTTLAYKPDTNWWGIDKITIQVKSNDSIVTKSIRVAVRPKPDDTVIRIHLVNETFSVVEDKSLFFQDTISLADDDNNAAISPEYDYCESHVWICQISLTLKVNEGGLAANGVGDALVIHLGDKNELTMKGLIADLNDSLKTLVYTPRHNFFGQDFFHVTVKTYQGESYSRMMGIVVSPVDDTPKLVMPTAQNNSSFIVYEDFVGLIGDDHCQDDSKPPSFITCQKIMITDIDQEQNITYKVNLYSQNGYLKFPRLRRMNDVSVKAEFVMDNFTDHIQLEGTIHALNYALVGIHFRGKSNYNSKNAFEKINVSLLEENGTEIGTDSIMIKVIALNDNPVIHIEGEISDDNNLSGDGLTYQRLYTPTLVTKEDSSMLIDAISVRDVDCSKPTDLLEISFNVFNGLILFKETQMHQWLIGEFGIFYPEIKFRGTIDDINKALKYLVYQPKPNFHGEDILVVHVSDMGNVGFVTDENYDLFNQRSLVDFVNISLSILPVEDFPLIEAPTFLHLLEDSAAVLGINLVYADSPQTVLQLYLKCSRGKIRINFEQGLKFIDGSTNDSSYIAVEGRVYELQRTLSQVVFTPPNNWNTRNSDLDKLELNVQNNDEEHGSATHVIHIAIENVNDPPGWEIPTSLGQKSRHISNQPIEIFEDNVLNLDSIAVTDVDASENDSKSLFTVRIKTTNGSLNIGKYSKLLSSTSNQKFLEFSTTFYFVNEALSFLVYNPPPDYHGEDSIDFFVMDNEFNTSANIPITILPVPDVPIIEAPPLVVCKEEEWCALQNILIDDKDFNDMLILDISVEDGLVAFAGGLIDPMRSISILKGLRSGDTYFQLNGTASNLNKSIQQLAYLPELGDAETVAILTLSVRVPVATIGTQKLDSTTTVYVAITDSAYNLPFVRYNKVSYHDNTECPSSFRSNSLPSMPKLHAFCDGISYFEPFQCIEDNSCPLHGLSVDDPDSSLLQLSLVVNYGELEITSQKGILFDLQNDRREMTLQGNVTNINRSLDTLTYYPKSNFVGKDSIAIKILEPTRRNSSGYSYEMTIEIIVNSVEDRIRISGPEYIFHSQDEDDLSLIPGFRLVHEHNFPSERTVFVEATIEVFGGKINMQKVEGLNFTIPSPVEESIRLWNHNLTYYSSNADGANGSWKDNIMDISAMEPYWWRNVSMCGLLENINNSLEKITFAGNRNMNTDADGLAEVNISVKQVTHCFQESNLKSNKETYDGHVSVAIYVKPVNDEPVVVAGQISQDRFQNIHSLEVDEDQELTIPAYVEDVDDSILTVQVSACNSGRISVAKKDSSKNNDIYFIKGKPNNFQSHLIMKGTIGSLNAFLINMLFVGKNNYFGNESTVEVKACDDHDSCHSQKISINIRAVDDAIQLYIPVDETLSAPRIVLEEGAETIIGSTWFQEENLLMKRVESSTTFKELQYAPSSSTSNDFLPLKIKSAFLLKDGNDATRLDESERLVCVKFTVDKGMISLKSGTDIHGIKEGELSKSIELNGQIDAINKEVAKNLFYHSIKSERGHAKLHIFVSGDLRCNGTGDECKCNFEVYDASAFLNIFVVAVNSAPIIEWITEEVVPQAKVNVKTAVKGIKITDDDMKDSDISDSHQRVHGGFITVKLLVTKGALSLGSLVGLTFIEGDGSMDRVIRIMGSLDNVNNALLTLEYRCMDYLSAMKFEEEHSSCQPNDVIELEVHVDDNGFTGKGGSKQDTHIMDIQIIA